jgi:hypothetical protein
LCASVDIECAQFVFIIIIIIIKHLFCSGTCITPVFALQRELVSRTKSVVYEWVGDARGGTVPCGRKCAVDTWNCIGDMQHEFIVLSEKYSRSVGAWELCDLL